MEDGLIERLKNGEIFLISIDNIDVKNCGDELDCDSFNAENCLTGCPLEKYDTSKVLILAEQGKENKKKGTLIMLTVTNEFSKKIWELIQSE